MRLMAVLTGLILTLTGCGTPAYESFAPPEAFPTLQEFEALAGCLRPDLKIEHRSGEFDLLGLTAVEKGTIWLWPERIEIGWYRTVLMHELIHAHGHSWHSDDPDSLMFDRREQSGTPPEPAESELKHVWRYCATEVQ